MNMEANIIGHDEEDCGVEVYDERGNHHAVTMSWDGEVWEHGTDDYPHKREDRTQDEQRIMSQVEERAKYAAQQEFPEADILDPMWDPNHLDRGIEALMNYPLDAFHDQFRDFYDTLRDPRRRITDERYDSDGDLVYKPFKLSAQNRVAEVGDVAVRYGVEGGGTEQVGTIDQYDMQDAIICGMPPLEFEDHITFEEHFHEIVVGHLMAQVRDIYLNMGEDPPKEYNVQGIGKIDIHGDGIGDT